MAYQLPEFNIEVQISHYLGGGNWGEYETHMAQLKGIPRSNNVTSALNTVAASQALLLKLPARTDVRDDVTLTRGDRVELPDWTGGPLSVVYVYDVAFGFPNEYRVAVLARANSSGSVVARPPGQGAVPSP